MPEAYITTEINHLQCAFSRCRALMLFPELIPVVNGMIYSKKTGDLFPGVLKTEDIIKTVISVCCALILFVWQIGGFCENIRDLALLQ